MRLCADPVGAGPGRGWSQMWARDRGGAGTVSALLLSYAPSSRDGGSCTRDLSIPNRSIRCLRTGLHLHRPRYLRPNPLSREYASPVGRSVGPVPPEAAGSLFDVARSHLDVARSLFDVARSHLDVARSHLDVARSLFDVARSHFEVVRRLPKAAHSLGSGGPLCSGPLPVR
ncbi:hypothetical protein GCM10020218_075850 [Dactylosporangium vinaceum]